ncbi:MAG: FAD-binding and (Fe-S)-binding domain-containing protein [Planctomycetota bacterium]
MTSSRSIARDLEALVGGSVRFGRHDRMLYATDASIYQVEPIGVVAPGSIDDAERVVRYCADHGLAVLPRGAGSSLAGQTVADAIVIDFSPWCHHIGDIDPEAATVEVEPGVVLDQLNRAAGAHGLMFGPDVASSTHATLGGMIGNNSAGAHSILYGRTVEHLEGLDVVLADGTRLALGRGAAEHDERVAELTRRVADIVGPLADEIHRRYPRTVRRVNGYNLDLVADQLQRCSRGRFDEVNLAHLFCGAEGTLGVTVRARLRLVQAPKARALALVSMPNLDAALDALRIILETKPAAVELIDDVIIDLARNNAEYRRCIDLLPSAGDTAPGAVLYVEYFGDGPAELEPRLDDLEARMPGRALSRHTTAEAMEAAWKLRKAGEPLLHTIPGDRKPLTFIEDTAVEPGDLPAFVKAFRAIVAGHGTSASCYAHASVGCLHIRPLIHLRDPTDRAAMEAIAEEVTDLVKSYGGALSGEHGDGRARSHLLRRFYGDAICDAFARVKAVFDPDHRMNPGNIVDPHPMTATLRVQPRETPALVPRVRAFYRYDREHGFGQAVEMCNGAGVCRKTVGGAMCPSYRALRDERHATRGRGNALRLALTGQFSVDGTSPAWDDPETIRTLDLCLSCKACKTECPSSVDIAKLKAEYTAQGYAVGVRIPVRARVFGNVRTLYRLGSAAPWLANAVGRFGPAAGLLERTLGIDRRRSLPAFGRSLYRWYASRSAPPAGPAVVLLPDCFSVYGEPHVGQAAVRLLEGLGYRVVLPRLGCCGRALLSKGMLAEAQKVCRATAEDLLACVSANDAVGVVACEPGCLSAVKDDWLDLDMGADLERLRGLAARSWLVEQFVEEHWDEHPVRARPGSWGGWPGEAPVLLHGHCHQKALWGDASSGDLLRRLLGERLRVLDTGCCGMAGSFGMTRDHYDLSMAIGDLGLFGAIGAEPEATVVAPGASCRHQILDGTKRRALHPVEVVAQMLLP